jgi:uncharacterized protein (DUF2249 family)
MKMEKPTWLVEANIKITLDARPLLAMGQHPLDRVINEVSALNPGEIYEILTPFPPLPMIEKLNALGFEGHSERDDSGIFHTYFAKG